MTNDPGLALITGKCADIGKFTVPQLRALAAREPYFHDGIGEDAGGGGALLRPAVRDRAVSPQEQQDLVNFLAAL